MDDLVVWLRAQLDEDDRTARACAGSGEWDAKDIAIYGKELAPEVREHMARHDPARVLREVEAKRGIVARYEFACNEAAALDISEEERETRIAGAAAFQSCVLLIASLYSARPGYAEAIAAAG